MDNFAFVDRTMKPTSTPDNLLGDKIPKIEMPKIVKSAAQK